MSRRAHKICWPAVLLLVSSGSAAQRPIMVDLADQARGQPPEFAADALLRIAVAPKLPAAVSRRRLIEDAFQFAASSQEPFARRNWAGAASELFDKAYAQGFDACTLQCRAVQTMLYLDPKKARELFERIPAPKIPQLSCEDTLVYDPSIFYVTLGAVAAQSFDAKEVANEEPLHLIERYVADVSSPVQIGPVARLLSGSALKPRQFEALVAGFAASLEQVPGDDRSFAATISRQDAASDIQALAAACLQRQISPLPVLEAWRSYLVRHLGGARCAGGSKSRPDAGGSLMANRVVAQPAYSGPADAVRYFNERMRMAGVQPISPEESQPASEEGEAKPVGACESPQCHDLSLRFARLVLGKDGLAFSAEEKAAAEWGGKLRVYLNALAEWTGDDPAEYFHWKSRFYGDIFNIASSSVDRDMVLSHFLAFLQSNGYQHDHRAEWFYPVNALIIRAFADPLGMKTTMHDLRKSADPVIALYAELERLLPRPLGQTVGLL